MPCEMRQSRVIMCQCEDNIKVPGEFITMTEESTTQQNLNNYINENKFTSVDFIRTNTQIATTSLNMAQVIFHLSHEKCIAGFPTWKGPGNRDSTTPLSAKGWISHLVGKENKKYFPCFYPSAHWVQRDVMLSRSCATPPSPLSLP